MFFYLRMIFSTLTFIAPLVITFTLPAYADGCPPGTVQIGERRVVTPTVIIVRPICKRILNTHSKPSLESKLAQSICSNELKIAAYQKAIQQMNFKVDTASFEEFEAISKEQKEELQGKLLSAFIDQGLEAPKILLKPGNISNRQVKKLKSMFNINNEYLIDAINELARAKNRRMMSKAYDDVVDRINIMRESYSTAQDIKKNPDDATLRFLLGALRIAQGNSMLGEIVTAADVSENLAYLAYLTGQIDELSKLTDDKTRRLNQTIVKMKQAMSDLKTAKEKWQQSGKTSDPNCSQVE